MGSSRITYSKLRPIQEALCNYWRTNGPIESNLALWMTDKTLGFARDAVAGKRVSPKDPSLATIAHVLEMAAQPASAHLPRWFWYLEAALHMNERMLGASFDAPRRSPGIAIDEARQRGRLCGAYSTPHYIAEALVGDVLRALGTRRKATMVDLSLEAGQFPVTVMAEAPSSMAVDFYGVDRDPVALRMSRKHFRFAQGRVKPGRFSLSLTCRDSLLDETPPEWPCRFDVVLGNPPWNVHYGDYTEKVRAAYQPWLSDHFDHYLAFILRAHSLLELGGLLGVVVPSSLLFNNSARQVRKHLLDNYDVISLRIFPRRSFIEIPCLVPVAMLFSKKKTTRGPVRQTLIEYHPMALGGPLKPRTSMVCKATEYWKDLPGQPFHPFVRPESARLVQSLRTLPALKEYGSAIRGAMMEKWVPVAPEIDFVGFQARDLRPFHACARGSRSYSSREALFQNSLSPLYVGVEKVLFQNFRFITHERRLIAACVGPGGFAVNTASVFVPHIPRSSPFFAALLNSSVVNAWFKLRDVSRTIKLELVREVPVPSEQGMKDHVQALAGKCANLRHKLHRLGQRCVIERQEGLRDKRTLDIVNALVESEKELDEIFYDLYKLSRSEKRGVDEVARARVF